MKRFSRFLVMIFIASVCLARSPWLSAQGIVTIQILNLVYDPAANVYGVTLSVTDAIDVDHVIFAIEDSQAGTLVLERQVILDRRPSLKVELEATSLKAGRKYILKVRAVCTSGALCQLATVEPNQDPTILATKEFQHEPPDKPKIDFTIQSVNADYAAKKLIILLSVQDPGDVEKYSGYIIDDGNQRVADIMPTLFTSPRIETDLPAAMQVQGNTHEYHIFITLSTKASEDVQKDLDKFKPVVPKDPSWTDLIIPAVEKNPVILAIIVGILATLLTLSVVLFTQRNREAAMPALKRPPFDPPTDSSIALPRLKFVVKSGASAGMTKTITKFPCKIGRGAKCDIVLTGDPAVSSEHALLIWDDGRFFVQDIGSRNGTFVDEQKLAPQAKSRLHGKTTVRLGPKTVCELQPI